MDGVTHREGLTVQPAVVLVDQHDLTRVALRRSLSGALSGTAIVGLASLAELDGHSCEHVKAVVLHVDHAQPSEGGLASTISDVKTRLRRVPIVTLSDRNDEAILSAAIEGGASAHLLTSMPLALVAVTLRLVMLGGTSFPPRPAASAAPARSAARGAPALELAGGHLEREARLTQREEEVLKYVGRGAPNKTIAFMLNMSENTVKVHLHRILQKFRLSNRTEAALLANAYFKVGMAPLSRGKTADDEAAG